MSSPIRSFDHVPMAEKLANWPLFDPKLYFHLNGDLKFKNIDPYEHFARHGCWEGRKFTTELRLSAELSEVGRTELDDDFSGSEPLSATLLASADIGVYCSSLSNFFMKEIAHRLAMGLKELGLVVTEGDETTPPEKKRAQSIIVAPHEFFVLGDGASWARQDIVADCVMLSTEQPQTQWFTTSLPYILSCRGILELCLQTSRTFTEAGLRSCFYMPGLPSSWSPDLTDTGRARNNLLVQSLPAAALEFDRETSGLSSRPIDVTFMASSSPIRDDFLSRHISSLRDLQSVLIYRRRTHTVPKGYADEGDVNDVNDFILRRSKVLLNIHRENIGYFEVHRLGMQGFWNLSAVVTNRCLPHPYFKPNVHFFEETHDRIPKLIRWLIKTPEGREKAEEVRWNAILQCATVGSAREQSLRVGRFVDQCFSSRTVAR